MTATRPPRDDLALWRATTRRRSTSRCGSTPTSRPSRRPPRGATRSPPSCRRVDWHRYPDRAATRAARRASPSCTASAPEQVFAANGSNEVLQTLLPHLRRAGPHGARRSSRPTQLHCHIARLTGTDGRRGRARRRLRARPRRGATACSRDAQPDDHVPVLAQQPDRAGRDRGDGARGARPRRPGCVVVDEAYGQFAPWSALDAGRRRRAARRHPHLLQDVVDGGGPPRLPRRAVVAGGRAREGRAAVPPRRGQAGRRAPRAATSSTRWRRGSPRSSRSGSGWSPRLGRPAASTCGRRAPTSCCSGRATRDGDDVWQGLLDRVVLVRNCASWPRLDGCLRVTIGTPDENDALPRRARRRSLAMSARRATPQRAPPRRRRSTSTLDLDGAGRAERRHGPAVLRPHARPARPPRRLRPHGAGHRRPRRSTPTTPSRTSASRSARRSREALGDKAGVRRFASGLFPLDEALVEVALDLSGRPFVVCEVPFGEVLPLGDPPFDPRAGRALLAVVRHRGRHHAARAPSAPAQHPPHRRGDVQGRGPLPARRRARRGRRRARRPRASL